MIKVNNSTNGIESNSYVYYVNAALLFTRIFGAYKVGCTTVNYASETMVLGETYTLNLPPGAYGLSVNIETSAYFSWTNCYSKGFNIIPPSLCLYTMGVVFHVACFNEKCNDKKIESLIAKYLLENPIDYKGFNVRENLTKCLLNNYYSNNICGKDSSACQDVQNINIAQIKNYIKIMKNYLPKDIFCSLNIDI